MIGLPRRRRSGGGRSAAIALMFSTVAFALMFAAPGSAFATAGSADEATVTIDNFTFTPAALTIKPGTKVTFVNHDDMPHSIVDAGGKFKSKVLDTDQSFSMTFAAAGDVSYFCGLHPHMRGEITVTPQTGSIGMEVRVMSLP